MKVSKKKVTRKKATKKKAARKATPNKKATKKAMSKKVSSSQATSKKKSSAKSVANVQQTEKAKDSSSYSRRAEPLESNVQKFKSQFKNFMGKINWKKVGTGALVAFLLLGSKGALGPKAEFVAKTIVNSFQIFSVV